MSTRVSQNDSCDWCGLTWSTSTGDRRPLEQPARALLLGDRVDPVVAPVPVDVQEPRREADLADPELLHDPQRVGVLGPDADLDAVQAGRGEAVVDRHRDRPRHHPAAGEVLVDPVADRGELRRPAHDVVDGQLAGERARRPRPRRGTSCRARAAAQPAYQRAERGRRAGPRRAAPWRPTAPARRRCAAGPSASAPTSDIRERAQRDHRVGAELIRAGQPLAWLNGRSPRPARRRARGRGRSTASPSFTPPREPGRLTTRQLPTTPASAARQGSRRYALRPRRRPGSPRRCPGTSRSSSGAGHLGGAVGRGQPGAAGGEHQPGAPVDRGRGSPRPPARRRARPPARRPRSPSSVQGLDDQRAGRVVVDPGRGAVGRDDDPARRPSSRLIASSPRTCRRSSTRPGRR